MWCGAGGGRGEAFPSSVECGRDGAYNLSTCVWVSSGALCVTRDPSYGDAFRLLPPTSIATNADSLISFFDAASRPPPHKTKKKKK